MVDKKITISENYLERLVRSNLTLNILEQGGVDNWSGYDYAYKEYFGTYDIDEKDDLYEQAVETEMKKIKGE